MEDFPWFKNYPSNVRPTVDVTQFSNVNALLEDGFSRYGGQVAYENMNKTLTYREVDELSRHFAAFFQSKGLKPGDRIAIQMPNLLQYPVVMFGAIRAGLVVVNTNPLYTAREMAHQFKDSGVKAIVILANFAFNLEKILTETDIETVVVTEIGDLLGGLKGGIVNFVVKHIKKMVPSYNLPEAISFKSALKQGSRAKFTKTNPAPDDLVFLQYTGGTTGVSKGAMLSHKNMVAHTLQINEWFQPLLEVGKSELMVTAIPLYHIFALAVNGIFMFHVGAHNLLITNPRDMKAFIKELKAHPFTLITGVNTLFNGLLNQDDFKSIDFSHMKGAIGGGMAVQRAVADKWAKVTGEPLVEGYGLSETSPVLCCNPLDGSERNGTIGLPVPNTEVAIFDEEGQKLPTGETGEICARGPQVMSGYWNRPEEVEKSFFADGWFRTGDMGLADEDGFFRIVDRKKDMINVSGFNVYPNEVEDVIAMQEKVLEVAAVGVSDEKSGEVVKIFVVRKDASLTEDELRSYSKQNLTGYKCPKYIEFRDELPKSNVGKILRRVLKEEEEKHLTNG
ncbi:AMP-binding protein [Roseivirga sp. BDSF3-8]|uniref:AMP-binding protein n=1 Tax=Roseivirga sp. BDSF3-8 TaxID=3241598 RepID=UPI0035318935